MDEWFKSHAWKASDFTKRCSSNDSDTRAKRGPIDLAGRVLGMIKNILAYAADEELISVNPAHDLQAHKIVGKKKVENYSRIDAREIPLLVRRINDYEGRAVTRYALKILMLTFVRTSELLFARWDEFDFEENSGVFQKSV